MPEFPCEGPIDASIHAIAGDVRVFAEQRSTVLVDVEAIHNNDASRDAATATQVDFSGSTLSIQVPNNRGGGFMRRSQNLRITVRMPLDSTVDIGTASADVSMEGRFGSSTVSTASGDLHVGDVAGDFKRNSASGDSQIGNVDGHVKVETASGDLRMSNVGGDLRIRSASADVQVDSVGGIVKINSASGDIQVGSVGNGDVTVNSASGDVQIGVAQGTGVWLDINTLSGDTRSELDMSGGAPAADTASGDTIKIQIHTLSGDVLIRRAYPTDSAAPRRDRHRDRDRDRHDHERDDHDRDRDDHDVMSD